MMDKTDESTNGQLNRPDDVQKNYSRGIRTTFVCLISGVLLAVVKIVSGIVGHSYALIADGVESIIDVVGSLVVASGLQIASFPPDKDHPYGHGKAEPLAALVVALLLVGAAVGIGIQSVRNIILPHQAPASFTLVVLVVVVIAKEVLFRFVRKTGKQINSTAIVVDAWHHRSDAITSAFAFVGISVALYAGDGYETADDWAALAACGIIIFNGVRLLRMAVADIMDAAPPWDVDQAVRKIAEELGGVIEVEKTRIRKTGIGYYVDIHIQVDGEQTVRSGHAIAHRVKEALLASDVKVLDALVHIEPADFNDPSQLRRK